jgi:hypothetical protein
MSSIFSMTGIKMRITESRLKRVIKNIILEQAGVLPMNKVKDWATGLSEVGYGWQVEKYKPGQLGRGASGIRV